MSVQQSLVLIKPDGLMKSLTGNIISTLSETKLKIVGIKIIKVTKELAEKHYAELLPGLVRKNGSEKGKSIFEGVVNYIMGKYHTDRVIALVYHGEDAISKIRAIAGETNPEKAAPISIRGKYGRIHSETHVYENVVHASDSELAAEREIKLWFSPDEITEIIYPIATETSTVEHAVWK
jgi:nucleoside-diphosphate kinase